MKPLQESLLAQRAVRHGFGVRGAPEPPGLVRPKQVHGVRVVTGPECRGTPTPEADAVVSTEPGLPVAVVTADCVPVLLATEDGCGVAAVHVGWRGLAAGVLEAGVAALADAAATVPARMVAGVGPHIGVCCYEVDTPVLDALARRFGDGLAAATRPVREGHALLDLGRLVGAALAGVGLEPGVIGHQTASCTRCDPARFHSYRRDGPRSGRLVHFIAASPVQG